MIFEKKSIGSIPIYIHKTKKSKSITITIKYFLRNKKEYRYDIVSLGNLFTTGSIKYSTKNKYLQAYSKNFNPKAYYSEKVFNDYIILSMNYRYLNGKYFNNNKLDKSNALLFKDVFFEVNHKYKQFDFVKSNLINSLKNLKNNNCSYAESKALDIAERNSKTNANYDEQMELAKSFSIDKVIDFYNNFINDSYKVMFIVGDIEDNIIDNFEFVKDYINNDNNFDLKSINRIGDHYNITEPIYNKEETKGETRLVLSYYFNRENTLKQSVLLSLFSLYFTNSDNSCLFDVLRNKNSLCYSVYSYVIDSIFYISLGIDKDNYEKCLDLIQKELDKIINGEINESILNQLKEYNIESIKTNDDNPLEYVGQMIKYIINGYDFPFDEYNDKLIEETKNVTIEDFIELCKNFKLDNVFFLAGDSVDEE